MPKLSNAETRIKRECVAGYISQGLYPIQGNDSVCSRCKTTADTIYRWKKEPEFLARIEELRQEARDAVAHLFIAQHSNRMALYNKQALDLLRLKEARSKAHASDRDMPGGDTGTLVKKKTVRVERKKEKGGTDSQLVTVEVNYDRAVDAELRELAKQAAIEQGDWNEKREITGAGGTPLIPIREVLIARPSEDIPEE